jgi:DNA primase
MSDTQLIKDKLDVVSLVGEYVQLKPAGVNHKGLCPFHREKSPSFMVNRERQSWHCFGCSKGGDIFSFVQEIEGIDFVEALKLLAQKAGVELTDRRTNPKEAGQKSRLKEVMAEAARFYHNVLIELPQAEPARAYLQQRGLVDNTIEAWQIGFIPDQWDLLTKYLLKKGHSVDDLVLAGLTIQRDGAVAGSSRGFYDRFRGRIMFPIWDVHGSVVGFTGRVLVETEHSGGKYVNTPQSPLYDKSRVVFGLNKAKQAIREHDLAVLVEGQMDVIACHQAGMENVVATSGTAMTEFQIQLLARYTKNVAIAFDADAAGQAAAKRGIDVALTEGMNIRVIRIPDGAGKDPDECVKKNPDVWRQAVKDAEDVMKWYMERALKDKDVSKPKDKQEAANMMLPEIARIPFAVERDHWLREFSLALGVEIDVLKEDLRRHGKGQEKTVGRVAAPAPAQPTAPVPATRFEQLLEQYFELQLRFPGVGHASLLALNPEWLSTSVYAPLYEWLKSVYTSPDFAPGRPLPVPSEENLSSLVARLVMKSELDFVGLSVADQPRDLKELVTYIEAEWKKQRRHDLLQAVQEANKRGDIAAEMAHLQAFENLR